MEKKYNYKFTPSAEGDLDDIFSYIALELSSPQAAEKLIDKIQAEVKRVCAFPYSCQLVNADFLRRKGYRILIVNNFNVFYIISEEMQSILIMRVLYGKRNYSEILNE